MRDYMIDQLKCVRTSGAARSRKSAPGRRGLTLMELVVVMSVLAALAAIVIPMFPNLLRRAHKVSDATQTSEISKAVQTYQAAYIGYPYNFDSLTDGTSFPIYLPGATSSAGAFGGFVTASTLTGAQLDALNAVGVTSVQKLATAADATAVTTLVAGGTFHPTRYPYSAITSTATTTLIPSGTTANSTDKFAVIDMVAVQTANPGFLQAITQADPTAVYVVFGVGARTSMIGQTIQDAPTSVSQKANFTPDNTYSRVGVIFKVSGNEVTNADNRAKFVAAVALEDDELESTEKDLVGYYQVSRGTN